MTHWTKGAFADEIKKQISDKKKGIRVSVATEFKKGYVSTRKGKPLPWAEKAAAGRKASGMYENKKPNSGDFGKGHTPWNKGKPMNPEAKAKMQAKLKGRKVWNTGMGVGTPLGTEIRRNPKYVEWRKFVFDRDCYACVLCTAKGAQFHADHIKPFALICKENNIDSIEKALACAELWDPANGRTLCIPCHRKTETYSGKQQTKLYKTPR